MSKSHSKPTFLLAPGAWHPPSLYASLQASMINRGYDLLVPMLPTLESTWLNWQADAAALVAAAEPVFAEGKTVVIVGHSYGGIPACAATRDNTVEDRKRQSKPGGFERLVYLCGFAVPKSGMSVLDMGGGSWLPWHKVVEDKHLFIQPSAKDLLCSDMDPEQADAVFDALVPSSLEAFTTGVDWVPTDVTSIPKTYIIAEDDRMMLPDRQEMMSASGFQQVRIKGGHSMFVSKPNEVADLLVKIVEGNV